MKALSVQAVINILQGVEDKSVPCMVWEQDGDRYPFEIDTTIIGAVDFNIAPINQEVEKSDEEKAYDLLKYLGGSADVRFELDNLDGTSRAFLETDQVMIENEHGTDFEASELSEDEFSCLLFELEQECLEHDKTIKRTRGE